MSALAVAGPQGTRLIAVTRTAGADRLFAPNLLTSQKDVWAQQVWMAKLGPKYTGNKVHTTFVEFLAAEFKKAGCEVVHDRYTLPRWEAKRDIDTAPASGAINAVFVLPTLDRLPRRATGELIYAGANDVALRAQGKSR